MNQKELKEMNEQKYIAALEKQALVGMGLKQAEALGDSRAIIVYRARIATLNAECRDLQAVVNEGHRE